MTVSSARLLLLLDPAAASSPLELLQIDLAGSESSILWLRSESLAGVEALRAGTGMQGARTGAVGTEVERTGSGVLGGGVGGGAGAFRFFSWLCEDGEPRLIYRGTNRNV